MKFYAIYDLDDNYITSCDTYEELSVFFGKTINSIKSSISRALNNKINKIRSNSDSKFYKIYKFQED